MDSNSSLLFKNLPATKKYRSTEGSTILDRHFKALNLVPKGDFVAEEIIKLVSFNQKEGEYLVKSSEGDLWYTVWLNIDEENSETECMPDRLFCEDICTQCYSCVHFATCNCPDYKERGVMCKHIHLARILRYKVEGNHSLSQTTARFIKRETATDCKVISSQDNDTDGEHICKNAISNLLTAMKAKVDDCDVDSISSKDISSILDHLRSAGDLIDGDICEAPSSKKAKKDTCYD